MIILLDPRFWAFVVTASILLSAVGGSTRSTVFGALNLVFLAVLIGPIPAAAVFGLALALWTGLAVADLLRTRGQERGASIVLAMMAAAVVAVFAGYKVLHDHGSVEAWMSSTLLGPDVGIAVRTLTALSFSYVFLRCVDAAITVTTGRSALRNPLALAGYLAPFHMLVAGPISSYADYFAMDEQPPTPASFERFAWSLNDISAGLFYKFAIAESLRIYAFGVRGGFAAPASLFDTMLLLVYIFFDFAGYSRVAVGIGRLCSIPTPENFNAPFLASSVTAFWTRWHMSLSAFVWRNIYIPLQMTLTRRFGIGRAHLVGVIPLLLAFGFVGLWHRFSGGFLLWGLGMGAILWIEKMVRDYSLSFPAMRDRKVRILASLLGPAYVFIVIAASLHYVMRQFLGI
jgi:D-alanyl-lipoteichoic acid acyltransferase DltB (MBOAT superfamily)